MKKVGLALGGGGARGVAHLAYLKALDEIGIRPSVISGTSSGAIVGALYAGGKGPDDILAVLQNMFKVNNGNRKSFKKLEKLPRSLISAAAKKALSGMLPCERFEDLSIPLKVVATNFRTLEERVFSEGDIFEALMSSIALPGVFVPQKVQDAYFLDGGATNVVPFDIIREECDILIAIDVSQVRPNEFRPNEKNAVLASWAATHELLISMKLNECPVEIFERPTFENIRTMEFFKYQRIYETAQQYVPEFINKIQKII